MTSFKTRLIVACMLATIGGSAVTSSATAGAGPFWHHRAVGEKGEGGKIEPTAPEKLSGSASSISLKFEIVGLPISIKAGKGFQVKSTIFNTANQGQIKTELIFQQPVLITSEGEAKGCNVTIGNNNIVTVKGHLAWKWNGEESQRKEEPVSSQRPDLIFTPTELPVQKPETAEVKLVGSGAGGFTTLSLTSSGCGAFAGTYTVDGSEVALISLGLGEFSKELGVRTILNESKESPGVFRQHFWNGTASLGALIGLTGSGNPANLETQVGLTTAQQEIAIEEK